MLKKLAEDFINKMIKEFNKKDNQTKINKEILKPIFDRFTNLVYPYVTLLFIMYSLNLIIIIVILVLICLNKKKSQ